MRIRSNTLPGADESLPGRTEGLNVPEQHYVTGHPLEGPFPEGMKLAMFGMGCFWGAERIFWELPGVCATAAGYSGGITPNPNYEEVCSGLTAHAEVVRVVFDPTRISYDELLGIFWEHHDPTQGMRQGNDIGTQYRSAIFTYDLDQRNTALASMARYAETLSKAGHIHRVTTDISDAGQFYFAEEYHQQYLAKNPSGYCGIEGVGVKYCG